MLEGSLSKNSGVNTNFFAFNVVFDFFFFFFFPSEASEPDKYRFKYSSLDIAIFEEIIGFSFKLRLNTHAGTQARRQNGTSMIFFHNFSRLF